MTKAQIITALALLIVMSCGALSGQEEKRSGALPAVERPLLVKASVRYFIEADPKSCWSVTVAATGVGEVRIGSTESPRKVVPLAVGPLEGQRLCNEAAQLRSLPRSLGRYTRILMHRASLHWSLEAEDGSTVERSYYIFPARTWSSKEWLFKGVYDRFRVFVADEDLHTLMPF